MASLGKRTGGCSEAGPLGQAHAEECLDDQVSNVVPDLPVRVRASVRACVRASSPMYLVQGKTAQRGCLLS